MNDAQRRLVVASVYPNLTWRAKVAKMTDVQILAVYNRMVKDGKIKMLGESK